MYRGERKKKAVCAGIFAGLCLLLSACGNTAADGKAEDVKNAREEEKQAYIQEKVQKVLPGFICFGDSLTFGDKGDGCTYPGVLQEQIKEKIADIPVVNMGACGEDSITVAGRSGAIPFVTAGDFVIPAGKESIEITIRSERGDPVFPSLYNDVGINPCEIEGVEGILQIKEPGKKDSSYFFTRTDSGEEVPVAEGCRIETAAAEQYRNYISILFLGTNGGYADYEDLIEQQNAILAFRTDNTDKFLVIGMLRGNADEMKEYDRIMEEKYGRQFLNLRMYLAEQGMQAAGLPETDADAECRQNGSVPKSLMADDVHLSADGYRVAGEAVYARLDELGYFEEAKVAARKAEEEFEKDKEGKIWGKTEGN